VKKRWPGGDLAIRRNHLYIPALAEYCKARPHRSYNPRMRQGLLSERDAQRLSSAAKLLRAAEQPVRVLRSIAWPASAEAEFFAAGAQRPPQVEYQPLDPALARQYLADARTLLTEDTPVDDWLRRTAQDIEYGALMLAGLGTPEFYRYSKLIYGAPADPLADGKATSLGIAQSFDGILSAYTANPPNFGHGPGELTDEELAAGIEQAVQRAFGPDAPAIQLVDNLASRAVAGAQYIRIRRGEQFSDLDLAQLTNHEALVHIATTLNGVAQAQFPILGAGHPGTTRTQEGLAVFSEIITGSIDPSRFARLATRTLGIQMAIDGADFMQLYHFFLERHDDPQAAFDSARRVVRGGVMTGGAPFTKAATYLYGLLSVHNFLRAAVRAGRFDCLLLLFCGKLDLEDVPALAMLAEAGLLMPPRYPPPWVADPRFLIAYLGYSAFLNSISLPAVMEHYSAMFEMTPRTDMLVCELPASR
jgi:uncharacterized protein (TIGR02421 family)